MQELKTKIEKENIGIFKKWLMIAIIEQAEMLGDNYTKDLTYDIVENMANDMLDRDCLWVELEDYMQEQIKEFAEETKDNGQV